MAEAKKFPSLPPNYVSLLQLKAIQDAKKLQKQEEEDRRKAHEEQARLEAEKEEEKRLKQVEDDRNNKKTCEAPDSSSHTTRSFRRGRMYGRRRFELSRTNPDQIETFRADSDGVVGKVYNRRKIEASRTILDEAEKIGAESEFIAGTVSNLRKIEASRTNPDQDEKNGVESNVIAGNMYNLRKHEASSKNYVQIGAESDVIAGNVFSRRKMEAIHTNPDEIEETRAACHVIVADEIEMVVQDGEEAGHGSMKKKKKNRKKGKPKKVEIMIGDVEPVTDVAMNENIPARRKGKQSAWLPKINYLEERFGDFSVDRRNVHGMEMTKLGLEKNGGKDVDSEKVWKTKEQIGGKLGDFSVNSRKREGREKTRLGFNRNGDGGKSVDSHKDSEAMLRIEEKIVEDEEKIECFPVSKMVEEGSKRNGGGARNKASRRSRNGGGGRIVDSGKVSEAIEKVTEKMEELDEKLGNPSVNGRNGERGIESNGGGGARDMSYRRLRGGGGSGRKVDSGRFRGGDGRNVDSRRVYDGGSNRNDRTLRDGNFVWVKKDGVSDGDAASIS